MSTNAHLRPAYTDQELLRAILRTDLYAFTQKVFETVVPGVTFSRNWSTEAVTHALEKVVRGETTRLIITIPRAISSRSVRPSPSPPFCSDMIRPGRSSASATAMTSR